MKNGSEAHEILSQFRFSLKAFTEFSVSTCFRDLIKNIGQADQVLRDEVWFEMTAFGLVLSWKDLSDWGTFFRPWATFKVKNGNLSTVPGLDELTPEFLDYLKKRAIEETHPILKARYSHLVWDLHKTLTGIKASSQFLEWSLTSYIDAAKLPVDEEKSLTSVSFIRNALQLALRMNQRKFLPDIIETFFSLYPSVCNMDLDGTWPFLFDNLNGNVDLNASQETFLVESLKSVLNHNVNRKNPSGIEQSAIRLAKYYQGKGLHAEKENVLSLAARTLEKIVESADSFIALHWLEKALEMFQDCRSDNDVKRVQIKKRSLGLLAQKDMKTIESNFTITNDQFREFTSRYTTDDLELALLMIATDFCPWVENSRINMKKMASDFPLQHMFNTTLFADGRPVAEIPGGDIDSDAKLIHHLATELNFSSQFLHDAIKAMLNKFAPSPSDLVHYIFRSPIFEKDRKDLILIALEDYLADRHAQCIHVLIPQIEYFIRKMVGLVGEPMDKTVGQGSSGIREEKTLGLLLSEEALKDHLCEDAIFYFRAVLSDKAGLNLRNRVSHGLMSSCSFDARVSNRLFHVVLLLSILLEYEE